MKCCDSHAAFQTFCLFVVRRNHHFKHHSNRNLVHPSTNTCFPGLLRKEQHFHFVFNDTLFSFPKTLCCSTSSQQAFRTREIEQPSTVWELDFYSRPVYGEDNKRIWELIVVDENFHLCHVESVPNNMINSTELRKRVESLLNQVTVKPKVIKFSRMPMFNMISLALKDLGVEVKPSRRTYRLYAVLRDREENVYSKMPGYRSESTLSTSYLYSTERLPDALRGEKFAFCTAEYSFLHELQSSGTIPYCDIFNAGDNILLEKELPGIIVYSERADSLASWTGGAEVSFIKFLEQELELVLECGINSHYRLAKIAKNNLLIEEAKTFEEMKWQMKGFHFYAIQSLKETPGTSNIKGLWLLNDFMEQ
ncbi:hypothetical protein GpartN1_g4397.t1 [Galdieria partita]|uniref:Uncharacterized protein n=1 Tax=Galdieria partita TaxID=83374 RepID=A0A9C7PXW5_9RHOD|nr:hypothetical protein GpartN1_g4397.t1 [Galdieria partita]